MEYIKLSSPEKHKKERTANIYTYKYINQIYLPTYDFKSYSDKCFFDIIKSRRSRRQFKKISNNELSELLWHTSKTKEIFEEPSGYVWEHRNTPSGGGRHPVDVLIYNIEPNLETLYHYDSFSHSLHELSLPDPDMFSSLRKTVLNVLDPGPATVLWFVAQVEKSLSKYKNGESLIWLDSGAILATLYFVAEALGLSCCAIGITGEPYISSIFKTDLLIGTCGFLVGGRVDN